MIHLLLAALPLLQPSPEVYSLRAVVADSKGAPIRDLATADVSLTDDGGIVSLNRFERDERPTRVALLLDSSQPLGSAYRLQFLDAAKAFIGSLPSNTRVSVWTTGDRPTKVIEDLDLAQDGSSREVASRLARVPPMGGNTILDAVVEAAEDLKKLEGERSVLVFVSGEGPGFASDSRQSITERVLKTGVEVMGVLISENGDEGGGDVTTVDYDYVFSSLTEKTAGRLERPISVMGAGAALRKVAADLGSTYRLSFSASGKRRFNKMALQVARPGVKVRLSTPQRETSSP